MSQRHQSYRRAIISWSSRPTSFVYLHCTMTESNSSIDSSFIFVGAEQSQVLPPSRPLTVTSNATFPSSISTPTSPIDSNSSSVGTLEVRDQCHFAFHSHLEPTLSQPITLPLTLRIRRLQLVIRPRLVSWYDWQKTHPGQAFRRRVCPRV